MERIFNFLPKILSPQLDYLAIRIIEKKVFDTVITDSSFVEKR